MKWVLFCLMATTVPVLYYMFVVGGFLPLIAIAAMSFRGVWGFVLFNALHLLIYGLLFYWVAKLIVKWLGVLPKPWRFVGFAGVAAALAAIAFLPVYGIGHHESQSVNLYRLLHRVFTDGM
jgi:hypothetical protein